MSINNKTQHCRQTLLVFQAVFKQIKLALNFITEIDMKLKQVLEIEKILGKTIPVDMEDKWVYYSESKDELIDIMELDVIHAIRIIRKHIGH
tara:strand:+ start:4207 stop:4482 length:276 start_codon:yes stop_codon:yes gene_type:complete